MFAATCKKNKKKTKKQQQKKTKKQASLGIIMIPYFLLAYIIFDNAKLAIFLCCIFIVQ